MSDAFEDRGEFTPDISSNELLADAPVATEPNAFEVLGLAPELVRAVADLGYTQIGRAHV